MDFAPPLEQWVPIALRVLRRRSPRLKSGRRIPDCALTAIWAWLSSNSAIPSAA
jgi:hypothetical protein